MVAADAASGPSSLRSPRLRRARPAVRLGRRAADWSAHATVVKKVVAAAALGPGVVRLVYVIAAAAVGVPSINTPRPGGSAPIAVGMLRVLDHHYGLSGKFDEVHVPGAGEIVDRTQPPEDGQSWYGRGASCPVVVGRCTVARRVDTACVAQFMMAFLSSLPL